MEIVQVIGWALFASVKFLFAPSSIYFSGYSFVETILITIPGGILGVVAFFYGGGIIFTWINDRFGGSPNSKRVFSRKNRIIIRVKNSYGLYGLAFLSPCLISIPIGAILAAKYYRHDKRTMPAFITAVVFWSFTLTSITSLFGPITWSDIIPFG